MKRFITLLVLLNISWNLLQGIDTVRDSSKAVVLAHGYLTIIVLVHIMALKIETIAGKNILHSLVIPHISAIDKEGKTIDRT